MVAYSFQKRFCDDVAGFRKRQTIRADRKRHARVGEPIQLYYAMRTKQCRKLVDPDPIVLAVTPIIIRPNQGSCLATYRFPHHRNGREEYEVDNAFARLDGFKDAADFTEFWRQTHPGDHFQGVLIKWDLAT